MEFKLNGRFRTRASPKLRFSAREKRNELDCFRKVSRRAGDGQSVTSQQGYTRTLSSWHTGYSGVLAKWFAWRMPLEIVRPTASECSLS